MKLPKLFRRKSVKVTLALTTFALIAVIIILVVRSNAKTQISELPQTGNVDTVAQAQAVAIDSVNSANKLISEKLTSGKALTESELADRSTALQKLADTAPEKFLELATLAPQRAKVPATLQKYVEQRVELKGTMEVLVGDNFETGGKNNSFTNYTLSSSGQKYILKGSDIPTGIRSGDSVSVNSLALGQFIVPAKNDLKAEVTVINAAKPITTGKLKLAVVLMHYNGYQSSITAQSANELFFSDTKESLRGYYLEASAGKLDISGTVFADITFNQSLDCRYVANDIAKTMKDYYSNIDLTKFNNVAYILDTPYCGSRGFAILGGNSQYIIQNTRDTNNYINRASVVHELGHNLGLMHANLFECGTRIISGACSTYEYGDAFDVMGNFWYATVDGKQKVVDPGTFHFNLWNKYTLGWLDMSEIIEIAPKQGGSNTYELNFEENSITGLKGIKINRNSTESIVISFRKNQGYDKNLPPGITAGVQLHLINKSMVGATYLLDMNPGSKGANDDFIDNLDSTLGDGKSFTELGYNYKVELLSHTKDKATVSAPIQY